MAIPQLLQAQQRENVELAQQSAALTTIDRALKTLRRHLKMDVAFVSRFMPDHRLFRNVDSAAYPSPLQAGDLLPLHDGYCYKVVTGQLPRLIPDTSLCPEAMEIPATHQMPIGAHVSVPLVLHDGRIYGTLCCFSRHADPTLNERDLEIMNAFTELIASQISDEIRHNLDFSERLLRITEALALREPAIVFQPIFAMADRQIVGLEALARFGGEPKRSPDIWISEAADVGMRSRVERQAIENAIDEFTTIGDDTISLSLNVSAATIVDSSLDIVLRHLPLDRVILEVTEHEKIYDYQQLAAALHPLRERGVRIAIDDAGSGYASMRHVLNIRPDIIKFDISLTKDIETDSVKRALAHALVTFAHHTGSLVVGEGVETASELRTLGDLGVDLVQGYHLGRPVAADLVRQHLMAN